MELNNKRFFDVIEEYISQRIKTGNVVDYIPAQQLEQLLGSEEVWQGLNEDELFKSIELFLKYAVSTGNSNFNNQLYGGFQMPAFWGEVLTALTNTSMATYEIAPVTSIMERQLVDKMGSLVGYSKTDGIMVTGGSNANMLAMMCARLRMFPNAKTEGYKKPGVIFVSKECHYSYSKAANILGIGTNNVIQVESSKDGVMDTNDLDHKIQKSIQEGKIPFFIGATAGTTVKAAFDPFEEISRISEKYNLWFHIDGAYGGSLLLNEKYRNTLLKGSELSDSFTWDAHKLMNIPMIASFFLTKHIGILNENSSGGGDAYIFHDYENIDYDSGKKSLQCGRRVDALKLWLTWKYNGDQKYSNLIEQQVNLAKFCESYINEHPKLALTYKRQSTNVCFSVNPPEGIERYKFNYELRESIVKEGKFLINYAKDEQSGLFFRLSFANYRTTKEDMLNFFDTLLSKTEKD